MGIFDFFRRFDARSRFAKGVIARLREAGWENAIFYDRRRFAIITVPDTELYLGDLYRAVNAAPDKAAREAICEDFTAIFFEATKPIPIPPPPDRLRPIIRSRIEFELLKLEGDDRFDFANATRPFCEVMRVVNAANRSRGFNLLDANKLGDLGFQTALDHGLDNLRSAGAGRFERQEGGFYSAAFDDGYNPSRILLPELFDELDLHGDPVAIAVDNWSLVVAGAEDRPALLAMAEAANALFEDTGQPVSCLPIVLRDGAWTPFDSEAAGIPELHALRGKQWAEVYDLQDNILQQRDAYSDENIVVARLTLVERAGWARTVTLWSTEAEALLPRADVVMIVNHRGGVIERSWESFEAVLGPLVPEPDLWPPRYRIGGSADERAEAARRLAGDHRRPPWFPEQ